MASSKYATNFAAPYPIVQTFQISAFLVISFAPECLGINIQQALVYLFI